MNIQNVYQHLDYLFESGQAPLAEDYLIQCLKEASEEGDYNSLIMLLNEMIGFCRETGQADKSMAYSSQVLQLMQRLNMTNSVAYATTLQNIANACRAAGKLDEAYQFYMEVFPVYDRLLEPGDYYYAGLYNNMSLLFQEMEDYERAMECQQKALVIIEQIEGKEFDVAVTHANIAATYCKLAEEAHKEELAMHIDPSELGYDKGKALAKEALNEAQIAIDAFRELEAMDVHMAAACSAYADALILLGDYEEAVEYYTLALSMIEASVGKTPAYDRVAGKREKTMQLLSKKSDMNRLRNSEQENFEQRNLEQEAGPEKNMTGLELAQAYYEAYGKSMIAEKFADYQDRIAVGLMGEGSDCLGFDDDISTDHDFGPGFAMWIDRETEQKIGQRLQEEYDKLPQSFMGYHRVNTPYGKSRVGVCVYEDYLLRIIGRDSVPKDAMEWMGTPQESLLAAVSGEIFADPKGEMHKLREQLLAYYPDKVWRLFIAQELSLFSQNGQYNYSRMMKRQDSASANLLLVKACENAMKLVYLLHKQYAPHTKWLLKGIEKMDQTFMIEDLITDVLHEIGSDETEQKQNEAKMEKIAGILLIMLKQNGLVDQNAEDLYMANYANDIAYPKQDKSVIQNPEGDNIEEDMNTEENIKKEDMVDAIVHMEWKAFDQVQNEGGRASCQDDFETFSIMRKSQYMTWNEEMLGQYIYDFKMSMDKGWNPITEKYARMMESTARDRYEELKDSLPSISEEKRQIMEGIIEIQIGWMEEFAKQYPKMSRMSRVIHTSEDTPFTTSYETYLRGELGTYSDEMLMLYGRFIAQLAQSGKNLAFLTMENTAHLYGYQSIEAAEAKL